MIFHDTHFNIEDLPCKSQSCASLGKFCANVVPEMKRNISLQSCICDFLQIASYASKIAHKIHISEKKSNLDIEKREDTI